METVYCCNEYDDLINIIYRLEENGVKINDNLYRIILRINEDKESIRRIVNRIELEIRAARIAMRRAIRSMGREERREESEEETQIVNTVQSFKSSECVICLTDPPNVLFCNCGHLCLCEECDKVKSLKNCPVCKT